MQNKIFKHTEDFLSAPGPEVEKWLSAHLNEPEDDGFFESIYRSAPRIDDAKGKQEILSLLDALGGHRRKKGWKILGILSLAAALVLAAVLSVQTWRISHEPLQKWNAEFAAHGQTREVTLPDNSRIRLYNDSRIVFPDRFRGKKRTVYVDGEIYAEIEADGKRPFIIDTKGARVKVLGTSFKFSSYSSVGKVALTLLTGKVELDVPVPDRELHFSLVPGDQLTVDCITGEYAQSKVDVSSVSLWTTGRRLYFIDLPLKEIVVELQEVFGTPIVVKDSRLLETRYLASFINDETLEAILDALNMDGKMRVIHKDNTYYLYPN